MLAEGFPSSAFSVTDATIDAYAVALNGIGLEYVRAACGRFIRGEVERFEHSKVPSAAELTREASRLQWAAKSALARDPVIKQVPEGFKTTSDGRLLIVPMGKPLPAGYAPLGPLKMDFGMGPIDMSWMNPEEKRRVLSSNGRDIPTRKERKELVA